MGSNHGVRINEIFMVLAKIIDANIKHIPWKKIHRTLKKLAKIKTLQKKATDTYVYYYIEGFSVLSAK